MLRRNIERLSLLQSEEAEALPLERLRPLYLNKTSEIIYIVNDGKVHGIVGMGEVLNPDENGMVKVNRTFTALTGYNAIKAYEIFKRRPRIHKIPVISNTGELLGDYSRWDDMLYISRMQKILMQEKTVKKALGVYDAVYIVEPGQNKHNVHAALVSYLQECGIVYKPLGKEQIGEKRSEKSICIFSDEDERRGMQCYYGIKPLVKDSQGYNATQYDLSVDTGWKIRFATFKSILLQIFQEIQLQKLNIKQPEGLWLHRLDEKATILLTALRRNGIKCFCMWGDEIDLTKYGERFKNEMGRKLKEKPLNLMEPWPERADNEDFFGELYQDEEYINDTAQKEFYMGSHVFERKKDVEGKYFNSKEGWRKTCYQPGNYIGTIYLLGPCMTIGTYVEDKYTLASCLQKVLLEKGYFYRVENLGAMRRFDSGIDERLMEIGACQENDIVIYLSRTGKAVGVEGESLEKIFERNDAPAAWFIDIFEHCNHKANQLVANSMLKMTEPFLMDGVKESVTEKIELNIFELMEKYVKGKYIDIYFSDFHYEKYDSIGAVVINCNPFSTGHRYLIEQAEQQVDFLIVFVIEEEEALFPFEDRFLMAKKGVEDLSNVMVVPGGEFILSQKSFQEYFTKRESSTADLNAEYDARVFADYIAKPLHITHRFEGSGSEDKLKELYNKALRKILPQRSISYVEIPRMGIDGEDVSGYKILKYLNRNEYDRGFSLVPETTKQYLLK